MWYQIPEGIRGLLLGAAIFLAVAVGWAVIDKIEESITEKRRLRARLEVTKIKLKAAEDCISKQRDEIVRLRYDKYYPPFTNPDKLSGRKPLGVMNESGK